MTKKFDEKQATKAVSGALMTLGRVFSSGSKDKKSLDIGAFSNELIKYSKGVGEFSRFRYYFVGDGSGSGRLSAGMAASAIAFIKRAITIDRSLYKGPTLAPLKEGGYYDTWKHKISKFRGRPIMYLTGATADAVGVLRYKSGGVAAGVTVGVRDNFFVSPPPMGGKKGKIKVRDYFLLHELGLGGNPQRPIVTGSMASWLAGYFPKWGEAFNSMMYASFWAGLKDRDKSEVEESYVDFGGSMKSSTEIASDIIQVANYMENSSKKISAFAQKLVTKTATGSKGVSISAEQEKIVRTMLRKELSGGGLTAGEVEEIIDTALTGRMPDFKSYRDN